ncbi:hypothetical protein SMSP2_02931 [Limihaloglobus sulfuriphilus]|uniref:Uncharacterized protein n=1 Tax=Limihaloglobus sulfuriphilus TaxID=1851148 RepID=A0A1Q2MIM5_9BACT|nr:hypothetical protein SMSP2_02931 [Limihaloglobus sulfuriphilus]
MDWKCTEKIAVIDEKLTQKAADLFSAREKNLET